MIDTVHLQNLKCEGCKTTILNKINTLKGISNINLDINSKEFTFEYTTHNAYEGLRNLLNELGYPFQGENNNLIHKTKSYISCAIGKL